MTRALLDDRCVSRPPAGSWPSLPELVSADGSRQLHPCGIRHRVRLRPLFRHGCGLLDVGAAAGNGGGGQQCRRDLLDDGPVPAAPARPGPSRWSSTPRQSPLIISVPDAPASCYRADQRSARHSVRSSSGHPWPDRRPPARLKGSARRGVRLPEPLEGFSQRHFDGTVVEAARRVHLAPG